jgi:peptide/nickel transport system substrate-binding protein
MKNLLLILLVGLLGVITIVSGCSQTTPVTSMPSTSSQTSSPAPSSTTSQSSSATPSSTVGPEYGGTLRMIFESITPVIGWPLGMIANPNGSVVQGCLETLLRADGEGNIYPWLAESYQIADDKMSITFTLRKGVKFHDGSDFNAEVVKWNLGNWIDAKAQPFWKSVDIVDDYTVRVNLTQWRNTVPLSFCEGIAPVFMISKAAFDKNGLDWVKSNPVGTGPFKFVSYTPDVSFKAVKNPDYWVKGKPYLDGIEITFVADPTTAQMLVQTGQVDLAGATLRQAVDYKAEGLNVVVAPEADWVLVPDTANPDSPWANQKVREAVGYAIDRESLAEAFGYSYLKAQYQIPPPNSLAYNPNFTLGRSYDPEKAKQLLTEAGYAGGFETTIIEFPVTDENIVLALQSQLAQVGIKVDLETTDFGKWGTYMGPGSWPKNAALFAPVPGFDKAYLEAIQFIVSNFGQSWARPPELMEAVNKALGTVTPDETLVRASTDIISQEALLIPVILGAQCRVSQPNVVFGFDERGYILYWNMEDAWLKK